MMTNEKEAPTLMTKEEFFARIDESKKEYEKGEYVSFGNLEDMNAWLNAL